MYESLNESYVYVGEQVSQLSWSQIILVLIASVVPAWKMASLSWWSLRKSFSLTFKTLSLISSWWSPSPSPLAQAILDALFLQEAITDVRKDSPAKKDAGKKEPCLLGNVLCCETITVQLASVENQYTNKVFFDLDDVLPRLSDKDKERVVTQAKNRFSNICQEKDNKLTAGLIRGIRGEENLKGIF